MSAPEEQRSTRKVLSNLGPPFEVKSQVPCEYRSRYVKTRETQLPYEFLQKIMIANTMYKIIAFLYCVQI